MRCAAEFQIPVQSCVLGAHYHSIGRAGTRPRPSIFSFFNPSPEPSANAAFGRDLALLAEAHEAGQSLKRGAHGADGRIGDT